jgi:hypothetical protein
LDLPIADNLRRDSDVKFGARLQHLQVVYMVALLNDANGTNRPAPERD